MEETTAFWLAAPLLALATAALAALLYKLIEQQGRLLLRLDQVERRLGIDPQDAIERGTVAIQARRPGGLPAGTAFPAFELPDLDGRPVALAGLRGRRVLLVHWSARCGFCDRIAPDLAALHPALERAGIQTLLISSGTASAEREAAAEHGFAFPVLLASEGEIEAFADLGTPAAYLLDGEGRIAAPLALGADRVPELARGLVPRATRLPGERPLAESRIERNGLPAGTPAPAFELPEVRGGTVALAEQRGRKVLLVFSDPHCGPCDDLAPHLARLHAEHRGDGLGLLLVSRGDPAENRAKAEAHGLDFPVVLQRRWEVSRSYGIFSTPVAFLIDEDGVIEKDVARGVDEILALAPPPVRAGEVRHA